MIERPEPASTRPGFQPMLRDAIQPNPISNPIAWDRASVDSGLCREEQERILVIRHGAFGDLIQADGALRDIRAHHPHADIALLVAAPYSRLMARCPHVDRVIADARASPLQLRRNLALIRRLRERRFHRVYDLQGSDRTRLYRVLMPRVSWTRRFNPAGSGLPDRSTYATQLAVANVTARHADSPEVGWIADDVSAQLSALGVTGDYIALIPGSAARHPHKRWPHYAALARRLADTGNQVVFAPGPDEMELASDIPCQVLLAPDGGCLDWFELAGVLRGAAFVVGNDTGPTHLAACLGRPGLALFGPATNARRTGLDYGAFRAIESEDLRKLAVDEVMAAINAQLAYSHA